MAKKLSATAKEWTPNVSAAEFVPGGTPKATAVEAPGSPKPLKLNPNAAEFKFNFGGSSGFSEKRNVNGSPNTYQGHHQHQQHVSGPYNNTNYSQYPSKGRNPHPKAYHHGHQHHQQHQHIHQHQNFHHHHHHHQNFHPHPQQQMYSNQGGNFRGAGTYGSPPMGPAIPQVQDPVPRHDEQDIVDDAPSSTTAEKIENEPTDASGESESDTTSASAANGAVAASGSPVSTSSTISTLRPQRSPGLRPSITRLNPPRKDSLGSRGGSSDFTLDDASKVDASENNDEDDDVEIVDDIEHDKNRKRDRRMSEKDAEDSLEASLRRNSMNKPAASPKMVIIPAPADGKREYSRDFLMQFASLYTTKFEGLPDLEAVLGSESSRALSNRADQSGGNTPTGAGGGYDVWRGSGRNQGRHMGGRQSSGNRGDGKGNRGGQDKRNGQKGKRGGKFDAPMDIGPIKPLEKTENAYIIKTDFEEEEKKLRDIKSILNKLTPEKFDILVKRVVEININNISLLKQVVNVVFEKTLAEPVFSPVYAEFCFRLSSSEGSGANLAFEEENGETQTFKRLILNQCQAEFEKENTFDFEPDATEQEKEVVRNLQRVRTRGTIRFIGELYLRKMLSSSIMKNCVSILFGELNEPLEENIESLCNLLAVVGKMLDTGKSKDFMDHTFVQLAALKTRKDVLSSRVRFKIQDTLELRDSNWIERRKEATAKKISEIRKEDAMEKAKQNRAVPSRAGGGNLSRTSSGSRDRYGDRSARRPDTLNVRPARNDRYGNLASRAPRTPAKDSETGMDGDDEWATVGGNGGGVFNKRKGNKSGNNTPRHDKSRSNNGSDNPSTSSGVGGKKGGDDKKSKAKRSAPNVFAGLDLDEEEEDDENNEDGETNEGDEVVGEDDDGENDAEEVAVGKIQSLIREYFQCEDLNEACECVKELGSNRFYDKIAFEGLLMVLDLKDRERELLPKLLVGLMEKKLLSKKQLGSGIAEMLLMVEDMLIDIPLTLKYIADVMAPMFITRSLKLDYLASDATTHLKDSQILSKLTAILLKNVLKELGEEDGGKKLVEMVKNDGLSIQFSIMKRDSDDVTGWCKENGLPKLI